MTGPGWRRSSKCESSAACVEVATGGGDVLVRDSKNPDGPVLQFTLAGWDAFVAGVRDGDFDE